MTLRRRIISVLVAHAAAFGAISAQAAVEPSELVGPSPNTSCSSTRTSRPW